MPELCSVCWKEVPALPECFEAYLNEVGQTIGWPRARSFALRELRTHLLEQRDCFLEEGMTEQEAENAAVREMGDAAMVGKELDAVHRPREQRLLLGAAILLSCLAVFLRFYLTAGFVFESPDPVKTAAALLFGLAGMGGLYLLDYRLLMRHAGKIYIAALMLGLLTWQFGPRVNHAAWHTRHVVLLYPAVYAIWLNCCKNKGWKGFLLAVLGGIPLAMIACMAPYIMGLFLLLGTGVILLLLAAGEDWFGIGRKETAFSVLGCSLTVGILAVCYGWNEWVTRRISMLLHPENDPFGSGYQILSVRNMLSGARWQGAASVAPAYGDHPYEYIVPEWSGDFLLTTIACKLGWLFFLLTAVLMLVLFGRIVGRAFRQRNPFGRILAVGAVLPMLLETVGAIAQNLGYYLVSVPIPVFSGNINMVMTMALLGLALSALRQQDLPEVCETMLQKKWKLVLVRE